MSLNNYRNFEDYLNSGEFEKLSEREKIEVYFHFERKEKKVRHLVLSSELENLDEDSLPEDRKILQPDGSRACINWEIAGKGFHLVE